MRGWVVAVAIGASLVTGGCLGVGLATDGDGEADEVDAPTSDARAVTYTAGEEDTPRSTGEVAPGAREVPAPLFEPSIGATSSGALFVANYEGLPVADWSSILRSTDQGRTWEDVTGEAGPVSSPPQSNDPLIHVDRHTDRVFDLDMQGLQCNWLRWSDDDGGSWTANPNACGQPASLQDHPTLFTGPSGPDAPATDELALENGPYENVIYICANRVVAETGCARSLDGGLTWSPWEDFVTGARARSDGCASGLTGFGTTGPEGTIYLPTAIEYDGGCGGEGLPLVTTSTDNGRTWDPVVVSDEVGALGHEVRVAVDDQGTVFAAWIDGDHQPYVAHSTDQGSTWSDPVPVGPPSVEVTSHPSVAATGDGGVAVSYIGTETAPANDGGYGAVPGDARWNAYLSALYDATAPDLEVTTVTVNPAEDPIALGECGGTRCRADDGAGIGDFLDVTIDDEGRPWAAYVDVCLEGCPDEDTSRDDGRGVVGTLAEGPSLEDPDQRLPTLDAGPS